MPRAAVHVSDDTFVAGDPGLVAAAVAEPGRPAHWFPGLPLEVVRHRGLKGIKWRVSGEPSGACEIWLEPALDGVVLHLLLTLHLPVSADPPTAADLRRLERRRVALTLSWKRSVTAFKDELEAGRTPGDAAVPAPVHTGPVANGVDSAAER